MGIDNLIKSIDDIAAVATDLISLAKSGLMGKAVAVLAIGRDLSDLVSHLKADLAEIKDLDATEAGHLVTHIGTVALDLIKKV